ncbi:MAG TPA: PorV/PorQ family protein [Candidatus Latescibacteria bacterium]|nr:PorV/PorQ family protein [Candidatus Latescibacterota bacterium]
MDELCEVATLKGARTALRDKMKARFKIIIEAFFSGWLAIAGTALADNPNVGRTGFGFLKVGVAARPAALGGAFVASRGDVSSIGINPASLAALQGKVLAASYTNYLLDIQSGFLGFGKKIGQRTVLGIGIHYMSYGQFQTTTMDNPEGEGLAPFWASELALQFSLSRLVFGNLAIGGGVKVLYSKIDTYSSDAYAFDFGILFKPPVQGLYLGASGLNMGFVRRGYSSEVKETLPVNFKLGSSYKLAHLPLVVLGDINFPNDNDPFYSVGGEFSVGGGMYLRMGYNSLYRDLQKEQWPGISLGTGFTWMARSDGMMYQVDYAYSSYAELGHVHRISLSGRF